MKQRISRHSGHAALIVSVLALISSLAGGAGARTSRAHRNPHANKVVRTDGTGRIPARLLPRKVAAAKNADRVGGQTAANLVTSCQPTSVDLGTWCLMATTYPLTNQEVGKNDYFFATKKCVDLGGYLPTAAQLIGAAAKVKLSSTIDDSPLTATVDVDPTDGLKDKREMSATLVTTAAGSSAAGSEGVTVGSKGDPKQGEPDPTPVPANPAPGTLQYVTVYDNHDKGGFAGGEPVTKPEAFRCAFNKVEGAANEANG